jgi:hypothetical protein
MRRLAILQRWQVSVKDREYLVDENVLTTGFKDNNNNQVGCFFNKFYGNPNPLHQIGMACGLLLNNY